MKIRVYAKGAPFGYRKDEQTGSQIRTAVKLGRNDPCYCGSKVKLKKCCKTYLDAVKIFQAKQKKEV